MIGPKKAPPPAPRVTPIASGYVIEFPSLIVARTMGVREVFVTRTEALAPTVAELQTSAQDLVRRMCALTEADVVGWSWDGPQS